MKNKFVIFWDWNGTIVDDAFLFVKIMNSFLREKKLPLIDIKQYKSFFGFPLIQYYKKLGFDFREEPFVDLGFRFIERYKQFRFEAKLFPEIKNLLGWLSNKNCSQFVVSAQEHSLLLSAVDYYNLSNFFIDCRGVDNLLALKKIEIAKSLKEKFIHAGDRVFVVGDTLHDFEVAKALGAVPVLVSYGHCCSARLNRCGLPVVASVGDLKKFFVKSLR